MTSGLPDLRSKSSISEELVGGRHSASKREFLEPGSASLGPAGLHNDFTLFNKLTHIFTEAIQEIACEENTNKTNRTNKTTWTLELEESPIPELMAELIAESRPIKPSKKF